MIQPQTSRRREPLMVEKRRLYIGIGDSVLAFDPATGEELWRTKLKSKMSLSTFVSVALIHGRVFASVAGELFCFDPVTGELLWHNPLKGLGLGYVTFAGEGAGVEYRIGGSADGGKRRQCLGLMYPVQREDKQRNGHARQVSAGACPLQNLMFYDARSTAPRSYPRKERTSRFFPPVMSRPSTTGFR